MKSAPTALWYLTRSTGIVSLILLTAVVILGVFTTMGWKSSRLPRFVSQALHRNLSLFALLLIGVHIVTTVSDGFAPIGYLDAVVPFHSPYRPLWLGLGALSLDLLLVVSLTSALRHRIGYRTWRGLHWLAYASWPVAVLHGLGTGTDAVQGPVLVLTAACVAAVVVAAGWRLAAGWSTGAWQQLAGGGAAAFFVVGLAAFTVIGPLRPGWARRAGTPTALMSGTRSASTVSSTAGTVPPSSGAVSASATPPTTAASSGSDLPAGGFAAQLNGRMSTSQPDGSGQVVVDIAGRLSGGLSLPFDISLQGSPAGGGGIDMSSGRVSVGSAQGTVVSLDGDRVLADIHSAAGTRQVSFQLSIDPSSGTVTGSVRSGESGSDTDVGGDQ